MLDIKKIKENPDFFKVRLQEKGCDINIDQLLNLHQQCLFSLQKLQELRTTKNQINISMKTADKKGAEFQKLKTEVQDINITLNVTNIEYNRLNDLFQKDFLLLPNILAEDVPFGKNEDDNIIIHTIGEKPNFTFKPKDHIELTNNPNNGLNFKKGSTLAKSRFVTMNGDIAKLHRVLGQFMLDYHIENGYIEHNVPVIVKADMLKGTGQLPKFEEDLFEAKGAECGDDKLYLIPTAEVPLTNMIRDERIEENDLPIKMTALTQCFRSEAGSYGRDTKGMIRQHQFEKVELVQIVHPEKSDAALDEIIKGAEDILNLLGLPFRKTLLCSGDTGFSAYKTYDLEVWLPSQDTYREISSCSNMLDFQSRRMGVKFLNKDGNKEFLHTLNGSGLAVGRTLIAVLENYQDEDGNIDIPTVLLPYFRGKTKITF